MLIHENLPAGHLYPQITDFPAKYLDFLAAFRAGQTIDNNLTASSIANTPQANMLKIGITSGHLTTKGNPVHGESLLDVFLTDEGAEQTLTPQDKQYCEMAVALARKSIAENDGEPSSGVQRLFYGPFELASEKRECPSPDSRQCAFALIASERLANHLSGSPFTRQVEFAPEC